MTMQLMHCCVLMCIHTVRMAPLPNVTVANGTNFRTTDISFAMYYFEVTRWALRKVGVEEWLVSTVMAMYEGAKTVVRTP